MREIESKNLESLTVLLAKMGEVLEQWGDCGARLSEIIGQEQEAIRKLDISSIESTVKMKSTLARDFEAIFNELSEHLRDFSRLCLGSHPKQPNSLSDLKQLVEKTVASETDSSLLGRVLKHNGLKLLGKIDLVLEQSRHLKPAIEANAYLARKLLDHHRENYRFWQEVALESSATYNVKGQSKPTSSSPMLQVKT